MSHQSDLARARGIAALFEQVGRNIYPDRGPKTLHPRQWATLRYFGRAGYPARTVTGLSRYIGITMAPASRSVASLVRLGLLRPEENQPNRKAVIYQLTELGRAKLTHDPLDTFAHILATLPVENRSSLTTALEMLLDSQREQSEAALS